MGAVGGAGMLSAGLLGGPGIGYKQDYFTTEALQRDNPAIYEEYVSDNKQGFLFFTDVAGMDGAKVGALLERDPSRLTPRELETKAILQDASILGGQTALRWTALVPLTLVLGYILLILYFRARGGYRAIELESEHSPKST